MKLADIKDERALDVIADIIDPLSELSTDEDFRTAVSVGNKLGAVKIAIKNHKKAIIKILACLEGEDVTTYHFSLLDIPKKVTVILQEFEEDEDLKSLFLSADVTETESSSRLENTEVENE